MSYHHHPHDYKSSNTSSSNTSSSTSSTTSTDHLTSTFANLDLQQQPQHEQPFNYATSQYAYLPQDQHRSIGVSAFVEPPIFRSAGGGGTTHDTDPGSDYHNSWSTQSSGAKDLISGASYTRPHDSHYTTTNTTNTNKTSHTHQTTSLSREDQLRQQFKNVIPTENPGYVEACYYFKFTMAPIELLLTLIKILDKLHVDIHIPEKNTYKLICRSYHNGGNVIPFIIRIWKPMRDTTSPIMRNKPAVPKSTNEYWCEFQRRSGDIIHFSELYHQCVQAVSSGNIESACLPTRKILVGIDDQQATPEEMAETLKCLVQMASSPCNDVKTQALMALSEMSSQNDAIRDLIIQHDGLETFLKLLMNTSEDVQRGATSGLANLAQGTHAARVASTFASDATRLARLSYNANASQQLIRESARALYNIGVALGASRCDATFRSTVKSFTATDPQARQHIHQLQQQLQIC